MRAASRHPHVVHSGKYDGEKECSPFGELRKQGKHNKSSAPGQGLDSYVKVVVDTMPAPVEPRCPVLDNTVLGRAANRTIIGLNN